MQFVKFTLQPLLAILVVDLFNDGCDLSLFLTAIKSFYVHEPGAVMSTSLLTSDRTCFDYVYLPCITV